MSIRAFIALELSDEARGELSRVEGLLKKADADVKWAAPEAIHITLKFFSNIPEEKVSSVAESLKTVASRTHPFDITLSGIGVFPGWTRPTVLWVGINKGRGPLAELAGLVRSAMREEGKNKEEHSFSPHITIGRIKSGRNRADIKNIADSIEIASISTHISRIVFFKSFLTKEGAHHTVLSTCNLTA